MQPSPHVLESYNVRINKPPATEWTFLFWARNARPLSRQPAPRGEPLSAQGAAGRATGKWTVCWKGFDSARLGFYGFLWIYSNKGRKGRLFMPWQSWCVCLGGGGQMTWHHVSRRV